jgi:hypothetical protein
MEVHLLMQGWQIERIRGKVDEMVGALNVRIFDSQGSIFQIWYNPSDDVALYARTVWDEALERERNIKAWLKDILQAVNAKETRIFVRYKNNEKKSAWFGPEGDMKPIGAAYGYIMSLTHDREGDEGRSHTARHTCLRPEED